MRRVIFGGASSLDNYIARPNGEVDWLLWGPEAAELMKVMWTRFDVMVMGRKTYEAGKKMAPKGNNPFSGIRTVVFSRTLKQENEADVDIVSTDPGAFVRDLKGETGKDICVMGGGEIGRCLLEAGVIDEIGFNIHPVLLGKGVPLFHQMNKQVDLELLECRQFKNGCVYVNYIVKH